jgi:hypothetical protein
MASASSRMISLKPAIVAASPAFGTELKICFVPGIVSLSCGLERKEAAYWQTS